MTQQLDLICSKQCFIFDMDGTIYLGENVFPAAMTFIRQLRAAGKRVVFYTNNASRSPARYVERLSRLGFDPTPDEILTEDSSSLTSQQAELIARLNACSPKDKETALRLLSVYLQSLS